MSAFLRLDDAAKPSFRRDLQWLRYTDQRYWILCDPITGNFFQVTEQERWVANQLNGQHTPTQLLKSLREQFPLKQHLESWLALLIGRWASSGLLIAAPQNQRSRKGKSLIARCLALGVAPLSIRIPLLRPSNRADRLTIGSLLFSSRFVFIWGIIALAVLFQVVLTLLEQPSMSLTKIDQLLHGDLWIYLLIALAIVKSFHELGHFVASRTWGVGCREIGILLLCFTPCLYCDVTDSWKLTSRWRRIAISAAGVYFELLLATVAAILWLMLPQGFVRTLSASIMVTCTISTLVINFNPFFRYDGYYILSDLWGVPNLMQQASRSLWAYATWGLGGIKPVPAHFSARPGPLAIFALIGSLYRLVFLFSLLWMIWFLLVPIGLGPLAVLILSSSLGLAALSLVKSGEKLMNRIHGSTPIPLARIAILAAIMVVLPGFLLCYPFRISFQTRGWASYADTQPLYATLDSAIQQVLRHGGSVDAETTILELNAFEVEKNLQATEHQVAELEAKSRLLQVATVDDSQAVYAAPLAEAVLAEYRQKLAILKAEANGLHLRSPRAGWLIPSSDHPSVGLASPRLAPVGDSFLDPRNLGAFVPRGAILGWLASSQQWTFETLVPETDMGQIAIGDAALARLDASPFHPIPAQVIRIAKAPIERIPVSLSNDPFVAATYDAQGKLLIDMPHYLVTLQTKLELPDASPGNRCFVRFQSAPESLLRRAIKTISRWSVFR